MGLDEASTQKQKGAFPIKIASWLQTYMQTTLPLSLNYESNNDFQGRTRVGREELDKVGPFSPPVDPLKLPELGYNITTTVDAEANVIERWAEARKKTADVTLSFRDNAKGTDQPFAYGFDMGLYLADLTEHEGHEVNIGTSDGLPADAVRIKIMDVINTKADLDSAVETLRDEKKTKEDKGETISTYLRYEFLSHDNTFGSNQIDFNALESYTDFLQAFSYGSTYAPQIVLLREILNQKGGSDTYSDGGLESTYNSFMQSIMNTFIGEVAANEDAFLYGAQFDDLTFDDIQYVTSDGQPYEDYETDEGEKLTNADQVLGISYDQYVNEQAGTPENTRILYLDPATYGGNYMNPPSLCEANGK